MNGKGALIDDGCLYMRANGNSVLGVGLGLSIQVNNSDPTVIVHDNYLVKNSTNKSIPHAASVDEDGTVEVT